MYSTILRIKRIIHRKLKTYHKHLNMQAFIVSVSDSIREVLSESATDNIQFDWSLSNDNNTLSFSIVAPAHVFDSEASDPSKLNVLVIEYDISHGITFEHDIEEY